MSKHTHTPGPWNFKSARSPVDGGIDWAIVGVLGGKQMVISEAFNRVAENVWAPAEANARLISAAPDLLAALEELLPNYIAACHQLDGTSGNEEFKCDDNRLIADARAAISKAKGEA